MEKLLKVVGSFAVIFVAIPWYGWVGSKLWNWFVVPLGARPLHVFQACGIALVASYFVVPSNLKRDDDKLGVALCKAMVWPLLALGFGALYHWLAA